MDKGVAEFSINQAKRLGASYADARLEVVSGTGFLLKNGISQVSEFDKNLGIGIRVIVDGALGFVTTNNFEREKLKAAISRCVKIAVAAARLREGIKLAEEKPNRAEYEVRQKIKLEDASPKEKLGLLMDIEREVMDSGVNVVGRYLSYSDFYSEKYFVNSEGSSIYSKIPRTDYFYFLTVNEAGKSSQRYWQYGDAAGFEKIQGRNLPALMKEEVMAMKKNMTDGISAPKEKIDVIAGPQVVGIMAHESVGHPYEADRILGREAAQAGESFLTRESIGTKIGSNIVTVNDDPTIENSFGFYLYDDEGVKAGKRVLIKNGIINELLQNRETASELNVKSNGAARANFFNREPIVRMANTYVENGDYNEEELIESVKLGVYIKNFTEWNIDDKRFNQKYVGSESFLIKNGKLKEPVRAPTIEITTPKLWSSIDAVGKNTEYHAGSCGKGEPMQGIPVWFGGPSIRIKGIRLAR